MNIKRILLTVLFSLLIVGCKSEVKSNVTNSADSAARHLAFLQETTGADDLEIAELFYLMRSDNPQTVNKAKAQLLEIAEENSAEENRVITQLIKGTDKICHSRDHKDGKNYIDGVDFEQVEIMANLLADFQSVEALDVLIDCSNKRSSVGGLSYYNYPTMPAIISYKTKALPMLGGKLKNGSKEIKCRVASILTMIGGSEAEKLLREAAMEETDEEISTCLHSSIGTFENK